MKKQGQMLMDVLGKAVDAVDDLGPVVAPLQDLAVRHIPYGAQEAHYPVVGECLLWTLQQGLGKAWNDDVKDACGTVYGIVSKVMLDAVKKAEGAKQAEAQTAQRLELNKKPLSARQIKLVKETWAKVTPVKEEAGKKFYDKLFEINPGVKPLFQESRMRTQAIMLMDILNKCVQSVEDLGPVTRALQETGKRHAMYYSTEDAYYPPVGENLLWFIADGAGSDFTDEAKEAWEIVYAKIATIMIDAAHTV